MIERCRELLQDFPYKLFDSVPSAPSLVRTPIARFDGATLLLYLSQASCSVTMLVFSSGPGAFSFVPPPATASAPLFPFASPTEPHRRHHHPHHEQHQRLFRHRSSTRANPHGGSVVVVPAVRTRSNAGVGVLRCSEGADPSPPDQQVSYTRVACAALK